MTGCAGHSHDHGDETAESLHSYIDHSSSYCLNEATPGSGVHILKSHSERLGIDHSSSTHSNSNSNSSANAIASHDHSHDHDHHDHSHHHHDTNNNNNNATNNNNTTTTTNNNTDNTSRVVLRSDPEDPDSDEEVELILHVTFTEAVKLTSFCIHDDHTRSVRPGISASPWKCKVFANRTDLDDFDTARELKGDVELEVMPAEHASDYNSPEERRQRQQQQQQQDQSVLVQGTIDYPLRGMKFNYTNSVTLYFGANYSSILPEDERDEDDESCLPTEISYIGFKGVGTNVKRRAVKAVYETRGMKKDHKVPDGEFGAHHRLG